MLLFKPKEPPQARLSEKRCLHVKLENRKSDGVGGGRFFSVTGTRTRKTK